MKEFRSVAELQAWLEAQDIDLSTWGQGGNKGVCNLWAEIRQGETTIQAEPPRRLVEVVRLVVRRGDCVLVEAGQDFAGGQQRTRNQLPSEKMRPNEGYLATALRCLHEELGVAAMDVTLFPHTYRRQQHEMDSPSYPGLCTRYTFHIVEVQVAGLPPDNFWTDEAAGGAADPVKRHYWVWEDAATLALS